MSFNVYIKEREIHFTYLGKEMLMKREKKSTVRVEELSFHTALCEHRDKDDSCCPCCLTALYDHYRYEDGSTRPTNDPPASHQLDGEAFSCNRCKGPIS